MVSESPSTSYRTTALGPAGLCANDSMVHAAALESRFSFLDDTDQLILHIKVPKISDLSFEVDGIPLHARNKSDEERDQIVIWATLGYLPFSITSREKRHALIQILEGTHTLPNVRFGVTQDMEIVVAGTYPLVMPPTPNYIFEPVINFIQESRPVIRLIAEYL